MKIPVHQIMTRTVFILLTLGLTLPASAQREIDPTRFEQSIVSFESQDKVSPPPQGAIVLTGSSSIARWNNKAAQALAPLTVIARGFGGSVMEDVLYYLDRVAINYKPRAILIYEGDNDTGLYSVPEDKILSQFEEIVARVHSELPDTRIYVMSVKPSVARQAVWSAAQRVSASFKAVADRDSQVYYIDAASPFLQSDGTVMTDIFVEDGLHLNDKGNQIWGQLIKAALMPVEASFE
ncbi:MAG: hypothetical protein COC19_07575 [SAR86 cluster bacterium]|uniref:SGNH hydrolase-type esterase domain-containing protein n=1 Tax=SAR86 cluster bacterium TaxID=2030880 RepID=A0A2A4MGR8_9GAMM|nr:MAG: hypothetical protein COC19_07575 [SAR86 cluster bacterium]